VKLGLLIAVVALSVLAGCGGDEEATPTGTDTVTTPVEQTAVKVYWLRDGKVWPGRREVLETNAVAEAALGELLEGPAAQEEADPLIVYELSAEDGKTGLQLVEIPLKMSK
jgi:hypothetical protein